MELALYCPVHGYYETKTDNPGRQGDYYTSVGVGEFFGQLLAFQFAEWLEQLRIADCGLRIAEAGAHDGQLAKDILAWLQLKRPKLFEQIEYWIIEPSPRRQKWQEETLKQFAPRIRWFAGLEHASRITHHPKFNGIIFSNELLDAMPVRRLGWDAQNKKWFEWGVTVEGGNFVWARIPDTLASRSGERAGSRGFDPSSILHLLARRSEAETAPSSVLAVLPDGYTIETCPAAESWWREAANVFVHGKLLTIDYGFTADELFSPVRMYGTLRAYYRHHASDDLLANVGEQDLTAHVNFSAIRAAGESAGLKTETFSTQSQFLTRILGKASKDDSFGEWNTNRTRQFQTLTHPEHLGRAFRVLVQSR